jgi:hypothetical protein
MWPHGSADFMNGIRTMKSVGAGCKGDPSDFHPARPYRIE